VSEQKATISPSLYVACGVLLGCALTLIIVFGVQALSKAAVAEEENPFALSLGAVRTTEGRLSGPLSYAPFPTTLTRRDFEALERSVRAQPPRSPEEQAFLLAARGRIDAAIPKLEEAVQAAPREPALLSDLSALYGERARTQDRPEDNVAALEMAERAVAASPEKEEPLFNRALALEHLFLNDEALKAWQKYLETDTISRWADEARIHLEKIAAVVDRQPPPDHHLLLLQAVDEGDESAIARYSIQNPQVAREVIENSLFGKWAEAVARDIPEKAARRLTGARTIAATIADHGGDRSFLRIVAEMERVANKPFGERATDTLVQSLRQFRAAQEAMEEGLCPGAIAQLSKAEDGLRSLQSAAVPIVAYRLAICRPDQDDVQATLRSLSSDPLLAEAPSIEARRQLHLGDIEQKKGSPTDAIAAFQRALHLFKTLGEAPNVAFLEHLIARSLDTLGRPTEAWSYRYDSLSRISRAPSKRYLPLAFDVLEGAVRASLSQRRPEAALDFENHLITKAKISQIPQEIVFDLLHRSQIEASLDRLKEAKHDFKEALSLLRILPPPHRKALAASIEVVRSQIERSEDRAEAIAQDLSVRPIELLGQQADLAFRQGDTASAENYLARALDQLERQREKVAPGSYRVSFFDQANSLYERMVALQLHLDRQERALEVLERFRARTLLDQLGTLSDPGAPRVAPLRCHDLCRRMPERTVIAVFAVIEDRLITWLVQSSGVAISPHQPYWPDLEALMKRIGEARDGRPEAREALEQLHRELVSPWLSDVSGNDRIIFVPTLSLYNLPFAALIDPKTGRFLVQDHAVGIAPSASGFVAAVERDHQISAAPLTNVLLVGDPAPDREGNGNLPRLQGSLREIESLSRIYHGLDTRILTSTEATPAHVLTYLGHADIVHLAVHAVAEREDPEHSGLVLASSGNGPGSLSARDILKLHLPRTRLVVMAACDTNTGPVSASEGSLSIGSAFLTAGVPAVVGSLWKVNDSSTMRLSLHFHEELRRGADALSALRTAQLQELATSQARSDWTWASFEVFGGVAERPYSTPSPTNRKISR
jgi:CHAT domain-containing protein